MVKNKRKLKKENRTDISLEYAEEMKNVNKVCRKKEKKKMKFW